MPGMLSVGLSCDEPPDVSHRLRILIDSYPGMTCSTASQWLSILFRQVVMICPTTDKVKCGLIISFCQKKPLSRPPFFAAMSY